RRRVLRRARRLLHALDVGRAPEARHREPVPGRSPLRAAAALTRKLAHAFNLARTLRTTSGSETTPPGRRWTVAVRDRGLDVRGGLLSARDFPWRRGGSHSQR